MLAAIAAACCWAGTSQVALAHPKPGAHADIRISVEPDGVHVDCLMNLMFADQLVRVKRSQRDEISPEEALAFAAGLSEYFGAPRSGTASEVLDRPNSVLIDQVTIGPVIRSVEVVRPEPETRPGFDQNPLLLIPRLHAKITYPCKSLPRSVTLVWGTYPRDFVRLEGDTAPVSDIEAVVTSGNDFQVLTFTSAEPEHTWHAPAPVVDTLASLPAVPAAPRWGSLGGAALLLASGCFVTLTFSGILFARQGIRAGSVLTLLAAGAFGYLAVLTAKPTYVMLSSDEALAIFKPLHENIYRAFDYTRDVEIFDALARSVDGPLLSRVYTQVYAGLVMQEEGGALSRAQRIDLLSTTLLEPAPDGSPRIQCAWGVDGVVYHWGHSHQRRNEYEGIFVLAPKPQGWRIVDVTVQSQRRIPTAAQQDSPAALTEPPTSDSVLPARDSTWKPDK